MTIAIFDANVIINLFDDLYAVDKNKFEETMDFLKLRFSEIWIPTIVKEEITELKNKATQKQREKRIRKYNSLILDCPITIGKNDIDLLLDSIHRGEADAILQTQRAPQYRYAQKTRQDYVFVSEDGGALKFAERMNLNSMNYKKLVEELREGGIEI